MSFLVFCSFHAYGDAFAALQPPVLLFCAAISGRADQETA